jgi:aqualysin 1
MVVPGCRPDENLAGPSELPDAIAPEFSSSQVIPSSHIIPNQYIVVFKSSLPNAAAEARALVAQHGGTLRFTYTSAIKGFAADLSARAVEALRHNPNVAYIEPDQAVELFDTEATPPSWGLDRVDQRKLPLSSSYSYMATGARVNVYIIDTGIRTSHVEFGGRAMGAYSSVKGKSSTDDCNGHGTHVAGTVGGRTYGIAKGVALYAVRVLDCDGSGSYSGVIAGIDWVTAHRQLPAVANMSLGGGKSQPLNDAVQGSIAAGVTYSVAAGNSNFDACSFSPASAPGAITVGATTRQDAQTYYSNWGRCVDLYAPGDSITSAWNTSDTATAIKRGTSMAAPHVAGAAALYLESHERSRGTLCGSYPGPDHESRHRITQSDGIHW